MNPTFSIMKGIAIASVVVGHCTQVPFIESFVNQYHLAIFFFVSGYFFKEKYLEEKRVFIHKKFKSLYIPFVISGLFLLLLHPLLRAIHVFDYDTSWKTTFTELYYLTLRLSSHDPLMGAMWFCSALLEVSLIAFVIFYLTKTSSIKRRTFFFILASIAGGIALHLFKLKSPYCLWQYLIVSFIYYLGWLFHQYEHHSLCLSKRSILSIAVVFGIALLLLTHWKLYGRLQPSDINNESVPVILFVAFVGCGLVYSSSRLITGTLMGNIFEIVGNYSFSIMFLHFLCLKPVSCIYCLSHHLPYELIESFPTIKHDHPIWTIAYVIAGCLLPIMCSKCYHTCKAKLAL